MTSTLLLAGIGMVAGVASGMFGIGGGVIIVPALILLLGFNLVQANGTSLAAFLLPVGLPAVVAYYHKRFVDVRAALFIAIGLIIGVLGGAQIALAISADLLRRLYGIFLFYISWRMIEPLDLWRLYSQGGEEGQIQPLLITGSSRFASERKISFLWLLGLGVVAGIASGMFGIGGGNVIVPVLVTFLAYDQKVAIGTSLAALMMPVGLPGVLMYANAGQLSLGSAIPVALGLLGGVILGAHITISLPSTTVKRIYGVFLLIIGFKFYFFEDI